jgi:hypothetical protein
MSFFRELYFAIEYICEDVVLFCKYPKRRNEIDYHWYKLWDLLIFHPWYALKRGLKNYWNWAGMIWGLDVWDHFFLTEMMDKQLEGMEKFWKDQADEEREKWADSHEKGWRCQYRRIHKRIKWTRRLMFMWKDEHYAMKHYDKHKTSFPRAGSLFDDDNIAKTTYDAWGLPISYEMKPMPDDERESYSAGSKKAYEMDKKVFKLWQKNLGFIQHWWH